ncbi:hypothetical protein DENSPDRAFT_835220 [Dentipellis sp. KUC8613]|nr:hypothetical protein DENSPDRAFT_835220 [Dentipellis sp. KUC8613]
MSGFLFEAVGFLRARGHESVPNRAGIALERAPYSARFVLTSAVFNPNPTLQFQGSRRSSRSVSCTPRRPNLT